MRAGHTFAQAIHSRRTSLEPGPAGPGTLFGSAELVGSPFSYGSGEEIFGEGEEAEYVYRIVSGAVRTCKILADGRRQINSFHVAGDLLGLETGSMHRLNAEAVSDTTMLLFRRRQLAAVAARDADVACQLWSATAAHLLRAEDHLIRLGRRTALERVAAFLLELDDRLGGSGRIELPMSRRDIADYLGLTLETVSRAMSQMQRQAALTLCGARHVHLDRRAVARLVEG